ncbi:MAG: heavy-metal-associated domain-containing protein [Actinomycetota bacterium]|nr:heavy-metal-associated domain-containing protein [Actinomycetota bacterium]
MSTQSWTVNGMTCDHCVRAVTQEVSEIDAVQAVRVDLTSGRLTVDSTLPLDEDTVAAAVDEAGYALVRS